MKAGELRHVIDIEQKTGTNSDGYGNTRQTWAALYSNVPAQITPYTSHEVFAGQKIETRTSHKIYVRYLPDITSQMRVKYGNRTFTINGIINDDERNISLALDCLEDLSQ